MRIAHVTSSLSVQGAGVRVVVEALARAQTAAGAEVRAFGLADADWQTGARGDWSGVQTTASPVIGPPAFGYAPDMLRALEAYRPDIVHLHGLWMHPGRSVLQWQRRNRGAFILSVHGMLSEVALSYSPLRKRLVRMWFQDRVFARAACLHATNPTELAELRRIGLEDPVAVLPIGVADIARPDPAPQPSGRTVLSLGRIHPKKGLDVLIRAWAQISAAFPDWTLRIVGPDENNHLAELRKLGEELQVPRLSFGGPVYGAARDAEIAAADIFALPTRSENFALTVAESLMLEVPVISSKGAPWSGLEENGCGRWVDLSPDDFAGALRAMMALPAEARAGMGRKGRAWMLRDFSWPTIGSSFAAVYDWAAGKGPKPPSLQTGDRP